MLLNACFSYACCAKWFPSVRCLHVCLCVFVWSRVVICAARVFPCHSLCCAYGCTDLVYARARACIWGVCKAAKDAAEKKAAVDRIAAEKAAAARVVAEMAAAANLGSPTAAKASGKIPDAPEPAHIATADRGGARDEPAIDVAAAAAAAAATSPSTPRDGAPAAAAAAVAPDGGGPARGGRTPGQRPSVLDRYAPAAAPALSPAPLETGGGGTRRATVDGSPASARRGGVLDRYKPSLPAPGGATGKGHAAKEAAAGATKAAAAEKVLCSCFLWVSALTQMCLLCVWYLNNSTAFRCEACTCEACTGTCKTHIYAMLLLFPFAGSKGC